MRRKAAMHRPPGHVCEYRICFSGCPVEMKILLVSLIFSTVDIGISGSVKVTVRVSLLCLLSKVKGYYERHSIYCGFTEI